jgi:phage terminase large subunit
MTEIAGKQMMDGDFDQAAATLKKVNHYAQLIHISMADNAKRLKNAEMLLHHTTYRLGEYLHKASSEDQATLNATLKQLDKVHDELLAEVLKH